MIQHIRRPLSAYAFCGAPAVDAPKKAPVCRDCAEIHANLKPQHPIIGLRGQGHPCVDYKPERNIPAREPR